MDTPDPQQVTALQEHRRFFRRRAVVFVIIGIVVTVVIIASRRLIPIDVINNLTDTTTQLTTKKLGPNEYETRTVTVNGRDYEVEVADTVEKRRRGLSKRENLETGKGMLFVFEYTDYHAFWMRDTLIPLDIVWLDEELNEIYVQRNAPPCVSEEEIECPVYTPEQPARYVLEVNAGDY